MRAGSMAIRDPKSARSRRVSGSVEGGVLDNAVDVLLRAVGSSRSASGLPRASTRIRSRAPGGNPGKRESRSRPAASSSSRHTSNSGSAAWSKKSTSPVRKAPSRQTWLPASRRATKLRNSGARSV